jgi:hypothetical protein
VGRGGGGGGGGGAAKKKVECFRFLADMAQ